MAIPKKGKGNPQLCQMKTTKKSKSRRHKTAINDFAEVFKNIHDMADQDQTASILYENDNLRLDKNNRFISIICPICTRFKHNIDVCLMLRVALSMVIKICGKAFCAPCGPSWGC